MKVAIIQFKSINNPVKNLDRAVDLIKETTGSDLVILPEAFICPNGFGIESLNGSKDLLNALSAAAKEAQVFLVAGSIPEIINKTVYNTCFVFNNQGQVITKYRKIHLFDVNLPTVKSLESDKYSPGNELVLFDTPFGKIGLAICYDLRFPELFISYAKSGAEIIIVPAAFSYSTGIRDWEVLTRARGLDSQCYIITCNGAKNSDLDFVVYGHSNIISPHGEILMELGEEEEIAYFDLDISNLNQVRSELPVLKSNKSQVYKNERN